MFVGCILHDGVTGCNLDSPIFFSHPLVESLLHNWLYLGYDCVD